MTTIKDYFDMKSFWWMYLLIIGFIILAITVSVWFIIGAIVLAILIHIAVQVSKNP